MALTLEQSLSKLSFNLIKHRPFYGNVLLRLNDASESSMVPTAAATTKQILYNREFMESLPDDEKNFVWLHELYHIILMHPSRGKDKEPEVWNVAADLIVNHNLQEDLGGLIDVDIPVKISEGALLGDKDYVLQRTTEQLYDELYDQYQQQNSASGNKGKNNSSGSGNSILDAFSKTYTFRVGNSTVSTSMMNPDLIPELEKALEDASGEELSEFKEILKGLKASWGLGKGGMERELERLVGTSVPWYRYLRRFVTSRIDDDTSFSNPDKRFMYSDLIMPGPTYSKEILTNVIIGIDTSGSITNKVLTDFLFQVRSLLNDFEMTGRVIFWDDGVEADVLVEDVDSGKKRPVGWGGTNVSPVLEYINKKYSNATVVIMLTDGCFSRPTVKSRVPVVWTLSETSDSYGKELEDFGKVIYIY